MSNETLRESQQAFGSIIATIDEVIELRKMGMTDETVLDCLVGSIFDGCAGLSEPRAKTVLAWAKKKEKAVLCEKCQHSTTFCRCHMKREDYRART